MKNPKLKVRTYTVVSDAVERGIALGLNRSRKHTNTPSDDAIKEQISNAIMNELSEVIDFGDAL